LLTRKAVAQVETGDRPYGVVVSPAGDRVCVAEQGAGRVRILDAATLETISLIPVAARPSGLAITGDGRTLLVTHLLANTVTLLAVHPYALYLPVVMAGASTGTAAGADASPASRLAGAWPVDPHSMTVAAPSPFASAITLWPDSNLVQAIVIAPDGRRAYVPHTRSNTTNTALTFDTTVFPLVSQIDLVARQHLLGQQFDLGVLDPPGVVLPFDAILTPDGAELWVVNAASNDLTVIDLAARRRAAHIEVGDNPRGIVLSPDGSTAYVNNTLSGTVSVVDTGAYAVTAVITTTEIPLPPLLLDGKRLFHSSDDPRVSLNQWIACNTCHFEGEHDRRTWSFGFAGKRSTTGLGGMIQTYPLRWSGEWDESANAEFAVRKEDFGSGLVPTMNCALSPPDCANRSPAPPSSHCKGINSTWGRAPRGAGCTCRSCCGEP
jgi:YVTN family beta-propeller protein